MSVNYIIKPVIKDLGGFQARRFLPAVQQKMVGPWIFFDHLGPVNFPAGQGINVRPHPHIHLGTVTYLFAGEMLHRDSLGSYQVIKPGDINLMIAGSGIVHSERERPEVMQQAHELHALQLWHALPEAQENMPPRFIHYPGADMPTKQIDQVAIRVMMGSAYGLSSPVLTFSNTLYLDAVLSKNTSLVTPQAEQLAIYCVSGAVTIDQQHQVAKHQLAILENNTQVTIQATEASQLVMVGGEAFAERHIEWNFVSSQHENIEQAKQRWRQQQFPIIPDDKHEYIPLPNEI